MTKIQRHPLDFLNVHNLSTPFDFKRADYAEQQYKTGLKVAATAEYISISENDVWSAKLKDGAQLQSYEAIGRHACTAHLMLGFLQGNCDIVVYREGQAPALIKQRKQQNEEG